MSSLLLLLLFYAATTAASFALARWLFIDAEVSETTLRRDRGYFARYRAPHGDNGQEGGDWKDVGSNDAMNVDGNATTRNSSTAVQNEDRRVENVSDLTPTVCTEESMLDFLQQHCCTLPVVAADVRILYHPKAFCEEMLQQIRAARSSIVMSALYLGLGAHSTALVQCLEEKIRSVAGLHDDNSKEEKTGSDTHATLPDSAHTSSGTFSLVILLDYNRMHVQRNFDILKNLISLEHTLRNQAKAAATTTPSATATMSAESGKDIAGSTAVPAVSIQIAFYQSHCSWSRLFKPFGRAKEALGVQHTKIFCFDGKHTILTGANLSDDYFTTRMDRYLVLENNVHVASWFTQLVYALVDISHPVKHCEERGAMIVCDNAAGHDPVYHMSDYVRVAEARMDRFARDVMTANMNRTNRGRAACEHGEQNCASECTDTLAEAVAGVKTKEAGTTATNEPASSASSLPAGNPDGMGISNDRSTNAGECIDASPSSDTLLFPTLQFGRLGIRHDSSVMEALLRNARAGNHLFLSSPYLNLHDMFVSALIRGGFCVTCITASVETNGWNGQRGLAGYIPYFYLQLERSFYYVMKAYDCLPRVQIREFAMPGLTFHAKGVWFTRWLQCSSASTRHEGTETKGNEEHTQLADATATEPVATSLCHGTVPDVYVNDPYLVVYGSSNYGFRSVKKDVEAGAILFTRNEALRKALGQELTCILQQTRHVTESRFTGASKGRFQPVVSLMAQLGQDFL